MKTKSEQVGDYLVLSESVLSASSDTRLPLERVHKLQLIQCLSDDLGVR